MAKRTSRRAALALLLLALAAACDPSADCCAPDFDDFSEGNLGWATLPLWLGYVFDAHVILTLAGRYSAVRWPTPGGLGSDRPQLRWQKLLIRLAGLAAMLASAALWQWSSARLTSGPGVAMHTVLYATGLAIAQSRAWNLGGCGAGAHARHRPRAPLSGGTLGCCGFVVLLWSYSFVAVCHEDAEIVERRSGCVGVEEYVLADLDCATTAAYGDTALVCYASRAFFGAGCNNTSSLPVASLCANLVTDDPQDRDAVGSLPTRLRLVAQLYLLALALPLVADMHGEVDLLQMAGVRLCGGGERRRQPPPRVPEVRPVAVQLATTAGLSPAEMAALRRIRVDGDDLCCCICLDALGSGDLAVLLDCTHAYHEECITLWLQRKRTCPACRTLVGVAQPPPPPAISVAGPPLPPADD